MDYRRFHGIKHPQQLSPHFFVVLVGEGGSALARRRAAQAEKQRPTRKKETPRRMTINLRRRAFPARASRALRSSPCLRFDVRVVTRYTHLWLDLAPGGCLRLLLSLRVASKRERFGFVLQLAPPAARLAAAVKARKGPKQAPESAVHEKSGRRTTTTTTAEEKSGSHHSKKGKTAMKRGKERKTHSANHSADSADTQRHKREEMICGTVKEGEERSQLSLGRPNYVLVLRRGARELAGEREGLLVV